MHVMRDPGAERDGADPLTGGGHRWVAVGNSSDVDSRAAAETAARGALTGAGPRLLMVFCSALHDPAAVLAGIRAVDADVPLIGCSSTTVIAPDGPSQARGVVVFA